MQGPTHTVVLLTDETNKDPRRKHRGISDQPELMVMMVRHISLALSFDVGTDGLLVALSADGAGETAVSPEIGYNPGSNCPRQRETVLTSSPPDRWR